MLYRYLHFHFALDRNLYYHFIEAQQQPTPSACTRLFTHTTQCQSLAALTYYPGRPIFQRKLNFYLPVRWTSRVLFRPVKSCIICLSTVYCNQDLCSRHSPGSSYHDGNLKSRYTIILLFKIC